MGDTIWKYHLNITDYQDITMPGSAPNTPEVLHTGLDPADFPAVWARVNPDGEPRLVPIWIVGTGNPFPPSAQLFIGSFVQGPFVWHVYTELGR